MNNWEFAYNCLVSIMLDNKIQPINTILNMFEIVLKIMNEPYYNTKYHGCNILKLQCEKEM